MAKKKDIMFVKEKRNRYNELSYELHYSVKDEISQKHKQYVKTIKLPPEVEEKGTKDIAAFRLQIQVDWKKEVDARLAASPIQHCDLPFVDYARYYVEEIIRENPNAFNHYRTCKEHLKTIEPRLRKYKLSEMTQEVIQDLCAWLNQRTYERTVVIAKAGLRELIRERKMTLVSVGRACGLAPHTLSMVLDEGDRLSKTTATKLCEFLKISMKDYFITTTETRRYAKSVNNAIKVFVHGVLQKAVWERRIERNYASREYVPPVKGTKKEKKVLTLEEIHHFIEAMNAEPDIRKRTAFACYIYLGLRNAEVCGLSWSCINLAKQEISIVQNTLFVKGFGVVSKDPKSASGKRTLAIPRALVETFSAYKLWWDEEKARHGDLWASTDKLFVRDDGKDMHGGTLAQWLRQFQIEHGMEKVVSPHSLRHSNITMLIAAGIDPKTVAARVGHSDTKVTMDIYTHAMKAQDQVAARKIDELFSS